eukprot:8662869-Pyramimonas_sp.AAC.1
MAAAVRCWMRGRSPVWPQAARARCPGARGTSPGRRPSPPCRTSRSALSTRAGRTWLGSNRMPPG